MANHEGQNNGTDGANCIRYDPQEGALPQTKWVDASAGGTVPETTAWTAHGRQGGTCPTGLSLTTQSAVGFSPTNATSVNTGTPFLLGLMTHSNNPIQTENDNFFDADLGIRFFNKTFTFPWVLNETPNQCSGTNCADDFTTFSNTVGTQNITIDSIDYKLVLLGFKQQGTGNVGSTPPSCPATTTGFTPVNQFRTVEGTQTYGCLYAELVQVRPLTIKKVKGGDLGGAPLFPFTSDSTLDESPWDAPNSWDLAFDATEGPNAFLPSREDVTVDENPPEGWEVTDITCRNGVGTPIPAAQYKKNLADGSLTLDLIEDVSVAANAPVVCTFTNTRKTGSLELKKDFVGTAGTVDLFIKKGATTIDSALAVGDNGTTGANTVETGTYDLSEAFNAGTNQSDYTTSFACTGTTAAPGGSDLNRTIAVAAGQTVVCTFTNTRKTGSLELKKDFVGTAGTVDLFIKKGATTIDSALAVGDNGTTGANTVETGTYDLSEAFNAGTNQSDYTTSFACTGTTAAPGGSDLNRTIAVAAGQTVVCTFTNTRKTGSLELKKDFVGTAGTVDLFIKKGATTIDSALAVGDNGTTGANTVETGTYDLSEAFNAGTNQSDYTTSFACTGTTAAPGGSDLNRTIAVAAGQTVVCTFTNTRKTGSLELKKDFVGTAGTVDLFIKKGATTIDSALAVGDNGTTGANTVETGTYDLSEAFNAGTNQSDYTTSFACTGTTAAPGGSDLNRTIAVAAGQTVVCTFTNTRKTGSLELKKDFVGTAGTVDLFIKKGATTIDSALAVGDNGTTGANTVETGTYDLSEAFNAGTNQSDYTTSFACTGTTAAPGGSDLNRTIAVAAGETVVCTFTNTRKTGSLELKKDFVGTAGTVDLFIKKGATTIDSARPSVTTARPVPTPSRRAPTTSARPSTRARAVRLHDVVRLHRDHRGPGWQRPRTIAWPTARPSSAPSRTPASRPLELKKDFVGTAGTVDLFIKKGATTIDSAWPSVTTARPVPTPSRRAPTTSARPSTRARPCYTTSFACTGTTAAPGGSDLNRTIAVAAGQTVVCTFTNTRKTGSLELKKDFVGTAGTVDLFIKKGATTIDSALAVGDNGTTGANTVETGTYDLSEAFNAGTNQSDYTTSFACTGTTAAPGGSDLNRTIAVAAGQTVVCTFTNTRKTGSLELKKDFVGTAGTVDLFIKKGATTIDSALAVGDNGTTGANTVETGTYDLSEAFNAGTNQSDYTTSFACTGTTAAPGGSDLNRTIAVAAGETVVCTFTNYYRELTLTKSATPKFYNKKGDEIAYTITATNTGAATLTNVDISDTLFGDLTGWTCKIDGSSVNLPVPSLAPTKSIVCTYTYTIKEATSRAGRCPTPPAS